MIFPRFTNEDDLPVSAAVLGARTRARRNAILNHYASLADFGDMTLEDHQSYLAAQLEQLLDPRLDAYCLEIPAAIGRAVPQPTRLRGVWLFLVSALSWVGLVVAPLRRAQDVDADHLRAADAHRSYLQPRRRTYMPMAYRSAQDVDADHLRAADAHRSSLQPRRRTYMAMAYRIRSRGPSSRRTSATTGSSWRSNAINPDSCWKLAPPAEGLSVPSCQAGQQQRRVDTPTAGENDRVPVTNCA